MAPAVLTVLPANMVTNGVLPMATIMDSAPIVNIGTFAMCQSPANPMVAVATAAAMRAKRGKKGGGKGGKGKGGGGKKGKAGGGKGRR
jgi:hypothetical protein